MFGVVVRVDVMSEFGGEGKEETEVREVRRRNVVERERRMWRRDNGRGEDIFGKYICFYREMDTSGNRWDLRT